MQAMAAYEQGASGLVLPRASLQDVVSPHWPAEDDAPSAGDWRRWEQAKAALLFKPVSSLQELAAFLYPNLPRAPTRSSQRTASRRRQGGSSTDSMGEEVGPASVVRVPLWGLERAGTVEACLVRGAVEPVRTCVRGRQRAGSRLAGGTERQGR